MARRQIEPGRRLGVARGAAAEQAAGGDQLRAGRTMDGAIDTTTAKQRTVGRVDDCIDIEGRDVGTDDLQQHQKQTSAWTGGNDSAVITRMLPPPDFPDRCSPSVIRLGARSVWGVGRR